MILWFLDERLAAHAFRGLWILNALAWIYTTTMALLIDPSTAKRSWREAVLFPGLISVAIMVYTCAPRPFGWVSDEIQSGAGLHLTMHESRWLTLFFYAWISVCIVAAYLVCVVERRLGHVAGWLLYIVGFGPLLCAVTFAAYVKEFRGAAQTWDKPRRPVESVFEHEPARRNRFDQRPSVPRGVRERHARVHRDGTSLDLEGSRGAARRRGHHCVPTYLARLILSGRLGRRRRLWLWLRREPAADQILQFVDVDVLRCADPDDVAGLEHATGGELFTPGRFLVRLDLVALGRHHLMRYLVVA